ncbi:MAG TPA: hypothetical protein VFJ01_05490 [Oleiagrimonas sp.]|nr:hypothetical protein [Oleiagrimonas sp.]
MSDKKTLSVVAPDAAPTMSDALEKWLQDRQMFPQGNSGESTSYDVGNVDELARIFDQCDQVEIAAQVMKGYCLANIRAMSPEGLRQILRDRDIALSVGARYIDLFELFSELPRLELLPRAAELGIARIRELKPRLGIEGIRQLVEGKQVDTLGYDQAIGMTKREIIAWRKQRDKLALDQEAGPERTREADAEAAALKNEPLPLGTARDELFGNVVRARMELERARKVTDQLLHHINDDWEQNRLETVHAARKIIAAVAEEAEGLDVLLAQRFGALSSQAMTDKYHTLPHSLLQANAAYTSAECDASLLARAKRRADTYKLRGAPPKNVDAVIAKALGQQTEPSDG